MEREWQGKMPMRCVIVIAAVAAISCRHSRRHERAAAPVKCVPAKAAIVQRPPKNDAALPTTDGRDYLAGFEGQISAAEKMVANDPSSPTKHSMLSGLLAARGKLFGDLDMVQRAIDEASRAIELSPNDAALYIARANVQQSLHRFVQARADLAKARALGATTSDVEAVEVELDWNEGRYDRAIAAIRAAAAKKPSMMTVSREARLLHDLGDSAGADRLYALAEDLVDDTSPVAVAFLNFQRGFHAFEIGRLDEALVFYREAVRRLPGWITAEEHLAEALVLLGRRDEALPIYESVVSRSKDPELAGALGELYRSLGRVADAEKLDARARDGFATYEAKYPEAAWGHAAGYFLGPGKDPRRALAMREANVKLRPNGASWAGLAEARLEVGDVAGAREAIDRALAMPLRSSFISWTAARIYARGRDRARARKLANEACALNPRSSIDEPPVEL